LEMFGKDKLVQDITLDDLDQEDLAVLNNGHLQVLPKRDQTGRLILANVRTHERFQNPINLLRAIYYIIMAAVEDEETQRKGIVGIVYNIGKAASNELDDETSRTLDRSVQLRNALPARYVSMHYCFNNDAFMSYINREICAFDSSTRARCRVHKGKQNSTHNTHELGVAPLLIRVVLTRLSFLPS
jgi:hypothetical protein